MSTQNKTLMIEHSPRGGQILYAKNYPRQDDMTNDILSR